MNETTKAAWKNKQHEKCQFSVTTTVNGKHDLFHLRASKELEGQAWIEAIEATVMSLTRLEAEAVEGAAVDGVQAHGDDEKAVDVGHCELRKAVSGRSIFPGDKDGFLYFSEGTINSPEQWVMKYFVLTKHALRFYDDQEDRTGKAEGEFRLLNFTSFSGGGCIPPKNLDGNGAKTKDISMEYQFRILNVERLYRKGGGTRMQPELLLCALSQSEMDAWSAEILRSILWVTDTTVESAGTVRGKSKSVIEDESLVNRTDALWRGSIEWDRNEKIAFSRSAWREAERNFSGPKSDRSLSDFEWAEITGNTQIQVDGADVAEGEYLHVAIYDAHNGEEGNGDHNSQYHRRFCQLKEKSVSGITSCRLNIYKNSMQMQKTPMASINLQRMIALERSLDDSCTFTITHPHNIALPAFSFQASSETQRTLWEHQISEALQRERHRQFTQHQAFSSSQTNTTVVFAGNRELPTVDVLSIKVLSAQHLIPRVATFKDFFATVRVGEHLVKTETVYDVESPEWEDGTFELDILAKPDFIEVALHAELHRPVYLGKTSIPILSCLGLGHDADNSGVMSHDLINTGRHISGDVSLHIQLFPTSKPTHLLVKVVEVRNLASDTNAHVTCNPFVQVSFRDVKKKTTVKYSCLNALFDEDAFEFDLPSHGVTKSEDCVLQV